MTALAGKATLISTSTDDSSYAEVQGLKQFDFSINGELLDTTDFADTSNFHLREIQGLKDYTINVSGDWERSDTGQARFLAQLATYATLYIRVLPDGTNGFRFICGVESVSIDAQVGGIVSFKATLKANGAYSVV